MIVNEDSYICLPGRIVSFDPTDQTATVQLSVDKLFSSSLSISDQVIREPIEGVPVHVSQGGGWSVTHPIAPGNTCKVSFSQVGYDHWLYENKDSAGTLVGVPKPWLKRHFSLDDGFCEVGYNPIPMAIASYSATNSEWRNADASQIIKLLPSGNIEVVSTTEIKLTAPLVTVACENAVVNATAKVEVTTPLLDLICATAVNITSPLIAQSGNMTVGGTLLVGGGIGGGGAAVPASGMAVTGPAVISGPVTASEVTAGTTVLTTHVHPGDGGTGSGPDTGAPS